MASVPENLAKVADEVKAGRSPKESVRTLLGWFNHYRRSWRVVKKVRAALDELALITLPDFEGEYIDSIITFALTPPSPAVESAQADGQTRTEERTLLPPRPEHYVFEKIDPTHRVSRLASANTSPVSVGPDASFEEAITLMMINDFSQLPVMIGEREVKGVVSWESIGSRLAHSHSFAKVRDCMKRDYQEVSQDASLFSTIPLIVQHEFVLVRDTAKRISGIVTATDISTQFHQLSEPFLLLGTIENHIRNLIAPHFTLAELQAAKDPNDTERQIEDVSDLTFGEYVRLLSIPAMWAKLQLKIDRKTFIEGLEQIRKIRNDVMHFDPDPVEPKDLKLLRDVFQFLDRLESLNKTS